MGEASTSTTPSTTAPALFIHMDTDDALVRFIRTEPDEVKPGAGHKRKVARPKPDGPKGKPSIDGT